VLTEGPRVRLVYRSEVVYVGHENRGLDHLSQARAALAQQLGKVGQCLLQLPCRPTGGKLAVFHPQLAGNDQPGTCFHNR
jgi:hypothetical protein